MKRWYLLEIWANRIVFENSFLINVLDKFHLCLNGDFLWTVI